MTIEINLHKLERGTHEGVVTVRRGGKVFQRKQRVGKKEPDVKTAPVPSTELTMDCLEDIKSKDVKAIDFVVDHGWNAEKSRLFNTFVSNDSFVFMENDKISGISDLRMRYDKTLMLSLLEINPDTQRQGKGVSAMRQIVRYAMENDAKEISLQSMDADSDKFYEAIGMENKGKIFMTSFVGSKEWMKEFIKAK